MSKDGGSAFPRTPENYSDMRQTAERVGGMSLRDYFAAASLPGLVQQYVPERAAELSYEYADAMLKARGK